MTLLEKIAKLRDEQRLDKRDKDTLTVLEWASRWGCSRNIAEDNIRAAVKLGLMSGQKLRVRAGSIVRATMVYREVK